MSNTQKITPFLWFDDQAEEAARFYVSTFEDAEIRGIARYNKESAGAAGRTDGSVMTVEFRIAGQGFVGLNGGPRARFTPAVSLFVNCADAREAEALFTSLADGGRVLMPFQQYPFSEGYGWAEDRYGLSWQVNAAPRAQRIAPCLLFVGDQCGRAEEAMTLYTMLFNQSGIEAVARYDAAEAPNAEGTVKHGIFTLAGQEFRVMDSALDHRFTFSEAVSFQVQCETQVEIDHHWDHLTEGGDPEAQQCGWLKDRFGVSWQIIPRALPQMLMDPAPEKSRRAMKAMLQMRKLDIARLEAAHDGR